MTKRKTKKRPVGTILSPPKEIEALKCINKTLDNLRKLLSEYQKAPYEKPEFMDLWKPGQLLTWKGIPLSKAILRQLLEYIERKLSTPNEVKRRLNCLKAALEAIGPAEQDLLDRYTRQDNPSFSLIYHLDDACSKALKDNAFLGGTHEIPDKEGHCPDDHLLNYLRRVFELNFGPPTYSNDPQNDEPTTLFEDFVSGMMKVISELNPMLKMPGIKTIRHNSFGRIEHIVRDEIEAEITHYVLQNPTDHTIEVAKSYWDKQPKKRQKKRGRPRKEECEDPKPEKPCLREDESTGEFFGQDYLSIIQEE